MQGVFEVGRWRTCHALLITAVAAIIPWLIVIIPGLWFLIRAVRRLRERRRAAKAAAPASA